MQVGFDAGNGRYYHAIPESRTPDVVNVPSKTNVGIPGMMVFKLSNVVKVDKMTPESYYQVHNS